MDTITETSAVTNSNGRSAVKHEGSRIVFSDGRKTPWSVKCSAGSNRSGRSPQFSAILGTANCARCAKMA